MFQLAFFQVVIAQTIGAHIETKVFSPEEVSAMIMTKLKETAKASLGKTTRDVVVTVPGQYSSYNLFLLKLVMERIMVTICVMFERLSQHGREFEAETNDHIKRYSEAGLRRTRSSRRPKLL